VRRHPYAVVLLDEIEKAHREVLNVLLQILEDGRLTDAQGRVVNFKNTLILMTSNLGATYLMNGVSEAHEQVLEEVRRFLPPELLNRIDELVIFESLDDAALKAISRLEVEKALSRLARRVRVDESVYDFLINLPLDRRYGARPIKRAVQKHLLDPLALQLLEHDQEAEVEITVRNGTPEFSFRTPAPETVL
jgi:ATP-dependent Clp protease ATP-binding subunit ClpB